MKLSFITVTYGRVQHLQTALRDFLEQDYADSELIICNSCVDQKLQFDHPKVKILNLESRPPSLGACRNIGVEAATGDIILTHDDDDRAISFHGSNFAEHFTDGIEWIWMENQFYAEKGKIIKRMSGSFNTLAFRKSAWKKAGKYNELSVGEDRHFAGRLTSMCEGKKISLPDDRTSFIYSWANNAYHISGHGVDTGALKPAYERVADDLQRRFKIGIEPKGVIYITPAEPQDLTLLVKDFMDAENAKNDQKLPVCIVMLGRYGDIANLLPICRHIAENYAKPHLMVAREFESILEGVSYVIPEVVDMHYDRLDSAMQMAQRRFPIVLRGQIWGKNHNQDKKTVSYNVESWRELGFLSRFNDPNFELVFDRRDAKREAQLVSKLTNDKPMLLVQVTGSISSPFQNGNEMLKVIQETFRDTLNIVDLGTVRAEKIYDIIGLMDKAVGMVAIDTAVLHLAAASTMPVVALVNPLPWAGSWLRCNCVERIGYAKATPEAVRSAIQKILTIGTFPYSLPNRPLKSAPRRRLFHAIERHEEDNIDVLNRKKSAFESWDTIYATGKMLPAHLWKYPRDAREIGEKRPLPFLKDVLMGAMRQADSEDIIVWGNDDGILHPELPDMIRFYAGIYDAVCSQRCDIRRAMPMRAINPSEMAKNTPPHFGRDIFAFKKWWLEQYWDEIPDAIIGCSDFDVHLTALIRLYHGIKSDRNSFLKHIYPAEMPRGYCLHIAHESHWSRPEYVNTSPGQIWNRKLWAEWGKKNLPNLNFTNENCI